MTDLPWYRRDPARLHRIVADALAVQPYMWLDDEGDRLVFRGKFEIRDDDEVLEAFAIDVQLPSSSPRGIPTVWETGGRIPRVLDPHHVRRDGSLCVVLPDAYWYQWPQGLTLAEFMEVPLRAHLAGQARVLAGSTWPNGEWDHGAEGAIEFYRELLGAKDDETLYRLMASAPLDRSTRRRMKCRCGSGRSRLSCHGPLLDRLESKGPTYWAVVKALRLSKEEKNHDKTSS